MSKNELKPTTDLQTDEDLSKFLLKAIKDVREGEVQVELAIAISKLADKYTKNEMMRCVKAKMREKQNTFDIESEMNKQLIQKT